LLFLDSHCRGLLHSDALTLVSLRSPSGTFPIFEEESDMTELRKRVDEAMVLRGFSDRTREYYLACVRALAKHYRQPPDVLDGPRIQGYLLHLITEKKLAYASVNQASCAFRFLFGTVLQRPEMRFVPRRPSRPCRCTCLICGDHREIVAAHTRFTCWSLGAAPRQERAWSYRPIRALWAFARASLRTSPTLWCVVPVSLRLFGHPQSPAERLHRAPARLQSP
jgi:hypothetical protein